MMEHSLACLHLVQMTVKVGINGFGRIGRNVLRAIIESGRTDIQVVAINDLGPVETNAHLMRHDSIHGKFPGTVTVNGETMDVGQENGSKKVLISAPGGSDIPTIVYGVNHDSLTADDLVVSNASCTTNCLAPVAYVLNNAFGIEKGYMTTIHSYTGDQPTLDTMHKDLYRARAAAMSMIPTSTGAAKAVGLVLPDLAGKLDGSSIRVPTPNVSVVDLKFIPKRDVTVEEVNAAIKTAAEGELKGILDYVTQPLVSMDFNHDPHSSNFAEDQTTVLEGNLVRILTWYDNEWGFSNRMSDTAVAMSKLG